MLSDLTAAEILARDLRFQQSVTFENPGSFAVVANAIKQQCLSGQIAIEKVQACCQEYNAKRNFINTLKRRLAKQIHLVVFRRQQPTPSSSFMNLLGLEGLVDGVDNHKLENFKQLNEHNTFVTRHWGDPKSPLHCLDLPGTQPEDYLAAEGDDWEEEGWLTFRSNQQSPQAMAAFSPKNRSHCSAARAMRAINPETRPRVDYPPMDSRNL